MALYNPIYFIIINYFLLVFKVLDAMSGIYHQHRKSYDSGIRTTALAVLLSAKPSVQEVRNIILSTINQTDFHMATYVLQSMRDLANHKPSFK